MIDIVEEISWYSAEIDAELVHELAPGEVLKSRVMNRTVFIAKTPDGKLVCGDDKCPHQGASLSGGKCTKESIVCPWHHYHFDLKTGRDKAGLGDCVRMHQIKTEENQVRVGVSKTRLKLFGIKL